MMEFASRYELEDPLVTTTVETFVAKDRETGEAVQVHVFPAVDHELTAASAPEQVLRRFSELTRAHVRIRAAGVDAATGYAYVVTPEIDREFIEVWGIAPAVDVDFVAPASTSIFASQVGGPTASPSIPDVSATPPLVFPEPNAETTKPLPPQEPPARSLGAFTKEFLALQSRAVKNPASKTGATIPLKPPAPPSAPGSFTEMFRPSDAARAEGKAILGGEMGSVQGPGLPPQFSVEPPAPPKAAPAEGASFTSLFGIGTPAATPASPQASSSPFDAAPKSKPGAFTAMFGAEQAKPHLEPASAPPVQAAPKPGGFTALFGAEEAKPHLEPRAIVPPSAPGPAAQPGGFTALFGGEQTKSNVEPKAMPPAAPRAKPSSEPGAFTSMFGTEETKAAHVDSKPAGAFTQMFDSKGAAPANQSPTPLAGIPAAGASSMPPMFKPVPSVEPTGAPGSPATRFFKGSDATAAPKAPAIPQGPSEYTRIVKFSDVMKEAAPAAPAGGVPPAAAPGFPQTPPANFQAPVMPGVQPFQVPQVAIPQYAPPVPPPPQPYGVPGLASQQIPQFQPPQAPVQPTQKLPAMAEPKSWMPLVILFLGLTVLALVIVLLFALKGH